MSRRGG